MDRVLARLGCVVCLGITVLTYAPSLSYGFVYEDTRHDGIAVVMFGQSWDIRQRWLTDQSYAWTSALWEATPQAARVVSLAWHLLNGVLLWLMARRVVTESAATMAAGLFLLHPLQTEAVAAIAYRSELVMATAVLIALWCASRGWLIPAFLCGLGAVTGKEMGVMALGLVPIWLWWTRSPAWTPSARVYWLAASLPACLLLLDHSRSLFWQRPDDLSTTIAAGVALIARIAVQMQLSIDHDWGAIAPITACAAVILTAGVLETAWRLRWRAVAFLGLFLVVAWAPRLLWQLGEGPHERHLYTPLIAVSVAVGAWLFPKGLHA